jgi:hypothetical protein
VLLAAIITWSVVSIIGTPTIEPIAPINLTGWESSAVSIPTSISPPTYAGDASTHTGDGLGIEGDSSDDEGDCFLPDDTVVDPQGIEDISWIPLLHGVTVTLR